ncbi:AMED_5909 family protein [Actinosynnema mirum]|uniref:AMED_5909 family protein n=1 Tax=Actinosynnema mirum TaxID=40567 RepID=UPI00019AB5D6|nr:AMED_5909 family protein [Actinosynnema mirum]
MTLATTLKQVQQALWRVTPVPDASEKALRAFYTRAAAEYRRVARTDPDHRHEALAHAQVETNHLERLTEKPVSGRDLLAQDEGE